MGVRNIGWVEEKRLDLRDPAKWQGSVEGKVVAWLIYELVKLR